MAWQYFSTNEKWRVTDIIAKAGALARYPVTWLRIKAGGHGLGAGMQLDVWPSDESISLGRMDLHGRWIDWTVQTLEGA